MTLRRAASRAWFGWVLVWNAVVLLAMWPFLIASFLIWPTARTFWVGLRAWFGVVLGGCGFRVVSRGTVPTGAVIYAANHQAMLDIPALALGIGAPFVFVARSELRRLPLVGSILHHSRCVFLDRRAPGGTEAGLGEAAERLSSGESVLFFPEGTRSYGGPLGPFYPGAFRLAAQTGVPVVPVAVDGAYALLNERDRAARPGRVTVYLGSPIPPDDRPEVLAGQARADVARMLEMGEGAGRGADVPP